MKTRENLIQKNIQKIKEEINLRLQNVPNPIAAFDADGTLWRKDAGYTFVKYQIENKLLPHLPQSFEEFLKTKKTKSYSEHLIWMAKMNKGTPLNLLKSWVKESFKLELLSSNPVFEEMKKLISYLLKNKVRVYIVSSSPQFTLEPLAKLFSIPSQNTIGVSIKVKDGVLTDELEGPLSWKEGKVKALLLKTKGVRPFFCAGNSYHDLPLLESATDLRLVISSAFKGSRNYETEQALLKHAKKEKWDRISYL